MAEEKSNKAAGPKKASSFFTLKKKMYLGAAAAVFIVMALLIANLASAWDYEVLYSHLPDVDREMIVRRLERENIPYKLSGDGSEIEVPGDRVAALRKELAAAGLPAGEERISALDFGRGMAYIDALESELNRKIVSLLEPYIGSGKISVNVKIKWNFDKVESTEETVDPEQVVKVSETSEMTAADDAVGRPAGSGIAGIPPRAKSEKSKIDYEVSKKVTRLTRPMGDIQRLSVAVLVDDAVETRERGGQSVSETRKRTPEELEAVERIVRAAVGFDSRRGDVIEVMNLSFTAAPGGGGPYEREPRTPWLAIALYTTAGLLILLLLYFIIRRLTARFPSIAGKTGAAGGGESEPMDAETLASARRAREEAEIERELAEKYSVSRSVGKKQYMRRKVKEYAQEHIDETAALVKRLLAEE
jgi:flagellar M-ring protein FliF